MSDRLPPEAVEAMARVLARNGVTFYSRAPIYRYQIERFYADLPRELLAALPAGVYRSDGQGKVEAVEARWYVYTCRSCDRVCFGLSDGSPVKELFEPRCGWHPHERLVAVPVAALSATDTEVKG